jgi:hypothetical protein
VEFLSRTSIVISATIQVIGRSSFSSCYSLEVLFESGSALTRIDESAFSYSGINSFTVLTSVVIISKRCFTTCQSLSVISLESGSQLRQIEEGVSAQAELKSVTILASVEVLARSSFAFCRQLTSIAFEDGSRLARIEEMTFHSHHTQSNESIQTGPKFNGQQRKKYVSAFRSVILK